LPLLVSAGTLLSGTADARNRSQHDFRSSAPLIATAAPTLAPFQHVRFCLRYPSECKSDVSEIERIELSPETSALLERVNRGVNAEIAPVMKGQAPEYRGGWTIAPARGDCNDYAVTKRHELVLGGLPAKALRLSVVRTETGIGHLVLVVSTTKGDVVLDNLTDTIRSWHQTEYQWLKIQSANDAKFWHEVKAYGPSLSQADRKIRLAAEH
jgi:predicted transglutaminase-like cysteine proteinase